MFSAAGAQVLLSQALTAIGLRPVLPSGPADVRIVDVDVVKTLGALADREDRAILAPIVFVAQPAGLPRWVALLLVATFVVVALRRAERTNSWLGGDGSGTGAPNGVGC